MARRWIAVSLFLPIAVAALAWADDAAAFQVRDGKKILIFGARQAVPNLDPHVRTDWSTRTIQESVYDALLKYEGNPPKLVPWLAESYAVSKDGMTYTFKLDKRAKFHSGEPVTAYDVKFSFQRILDLKPGPAVLYMDIVDRESLTVVDIHTFQVSLKKPYAPFIATVPWLYIVSWKQVMDKATNNDYGQKWLMSNEAGSGPFTIRRWEAGNLYELEAVDNYGLALLGWLIAQPWFYTGLGMTQPSTHAALMLFMLVVPVFMFFLQPLFTWSSRRYEYEADSFAAEQIDANDLVNALVKLYKENASTLTPDPLHSAFYDSHPPAALRIAHLAGKT